MPTKNKVRKTKRKGPPGEKVRKLEITVRKVSERPKPPIALYVFLLFGLVGFFLIDPPLWVHPAASLLVAYCTVALTWEKILSNFGPPDLLRKIKHIVREELDQQTQIKEISSSPFESIYQVRDSHPSIQLGDAFFKIMDLQTFFAGIQAAAALMEVWGLSRDRGAAVDAYYRVKEESRHNPEILAKATNLQFYIQKHPVLGRLFYARLGRCEDNLEKFLREPNNEEDLPKAVERFNRCKCLILHSLMNAQGGELDGELSDLWEMLKCDILLDDSAED